MKKSWLLLLLLIPLVYMSCNKPKRHGLPFANVKGIHFSEVRRAFDNGLVFDKQGYQLVPSWKCYFISDDSVRVFSPTMKKYYGFHVYFDHDSVFNMVGTWLKVQKINKDSLVFRALRVENKVILDNDEGSKVIVIFYSDRYIKEKGAKFIRQKGQPSRSDTLFIKQKAIFGNTHPDSTFAATEPVIFKSKTTLATVAQVKSVSTPLEKIDEDLDYLSPEYNITIYKAYEDFDYSYYVFVDDKGNMRFKKSTVPYLPEYKETYEKIMKGITDGYLKLYLDVTPGKTLGIAHSTSILINVEGKRSTPPAAN